MPNATHVIATGRPPPDMRWLIVFAVGSAAKMAAVRRVPVCCFQIAPLPHGSAEPCTPVLRGLPRGRYTACQIRGNPTT